ncbi:MAG: M15 family metallopeptidase [Gammaproteobacteria bacterium]|nr:M15 family metallopeptidase [Gammaproteobacteria bacterium]MBU1654701.1 M15 family metallopeptidase [Gammaproteobacteria bacterium]MBU1961425.1 M15 family metallopeptidase [Gammaproteobacteria bacterium]
MNPSPRPALLLLFLFLLPALIQAGDDPAERLAKAYPGFIKGQQGGDLIWSDGSQMPLDDGRKKTFDQLLDEPDIQDQFTWTYPTGPSSYSPPGFNTDPGRVRYEPLFKKMYGADSGAVQRNLVRVRWMPKSANSTVMITRVNGVDKKLEAVSRELDALPPSIRKYAYPTAGTFNWRPIAGTKRLSTHSFGTAIDLNTKYTDYWKWDKKMAYKNQMPREIVEIFEKHGFIWGGKWYHYDTMHFEYRPELLNP